MNRGSDDASHRREHAVEALRLLAEVAVSLDRPAAASADTDTPLFDTALASFVGVHDFSARPRARRLLPGPFPTEAGPDGMGELERALQVSTAGGRQVRARTARSSRHMPAGMRPRLRPP